MVAGKTRRNQIIFIQEKAQTDVQL